MTQTYRRRDITLDQQVALKHAATRLGRDFVGTFGVETIERFLHSSYDQFAGRATVANFLPLLAERFARQRLQALAKVEGLSHDGRPTVLFLCVHNAGRSQMAMGFFAQHAGERAVAWSGGSEPGEQVNPSAIAAMKERGIDISAEYPKPWTDEVVRAADVVITMGCGDACPVFPGKRYEEWTLDDPAGLEVADVRPIRDEIERAGARALPLAERPHDDRNADQARQEPERQARQPVPQRQVWAVVDVERGEHREVGHAHAGDVGGVAGTVLAPVQVADRRRRECDQADQGQVVVLAGPHRRQHERGRDHDSECPVVPAAGSHVALAAFCRQRRRGAGEDRAEPGEHVHTQHREEQRRGRADFGTEDPSGIGHDRTSYT
jgi:arsenate reductase